MKTIWRRRGIPGRFCAGILVVFVLPFLPAPSSGAAPGSPIIVTMNDRPSKFVPEKLTVKIGDTVEWRNTGKLIHRISTAAPLPSGAQRFDSGVMSSGAIYRHTFSAPGTYRIVCMPHFATGMVGEIIVTK